MASQAKTWSNNTALSASIRCHKAHYDD